MKDRTIHFILLLLMQSAMATSLHAQTPSTQTKKSITDSVYTLGNVEVRGSRIQKEIIPVQILSGSQLQRMNTLSVADALRYFSGVQIKDYGGIGGLKTVNIRSMGSQHVGVYYDGIELGNAQNGVIDLGRFSLDNMESISMYNGQKSAIFQPAKDYASASSIYMQTRQPSFANGKRDNINVSLKGGSFSTINPSLLWEHKLSDKVSSSVSAEYMYTTGKYKFSYSKKNGYDTTEVRKNGDVRSFRIEAALFGKLNQGEWKAKMYLYNSERGYPGAAVREEPGKFTHQDRQWDNSVFVQGSLQKKLLPFYSIMVSGKYAYDYLHYLSDPRLDVTTMYVDNKYRQQETYLSVANLFTICDWWTADLSIDGQWNKLNADLTDFVYPNRYSVLSAAATSIQFEKFKLQASLLHTYVHETTRTGTPAGDKSVFTPTVVASYKPFSDIGLNLRAFYKRVFRMPTLNDLYYTFIGNKDLKPEYTTQYDVGFTYTKPFSKLWLQQVELQVDGYFNQVDDKIIAMPTSNQFRWTMLNLGNVEIRGVDVALQTNWRITNVDVNARFTYTYQKAQDFTDSKDSYYGGQIPYIPWHSGSAIIGVIYRGWGLNYSFIYTGERYESVANIPENYAQPWYTHDLSLSRDFPFKTFTTRLTLEVNNVFNQQYEVVQCYPMPGTNFKVKLNIII